MAASTLTVFVQVTEANIRQLLSSVGLEPVVNNLLSAAEALGARLEGDTSDLEKLDTQLKQYEDRITFLQSSEESLKAAHQKRETHLEAQLQQLMSLDCQRQATAENEKRQYEEGMASTKRQLDDLTRDKETYVQNTAELSRRVQEAERVYHEAQEARKRVEEERARAQEVSSQAEALRQQTAVIQEMPRELTGQEVRLGLLHTVKEFVLFDVNRCLVMQEELQTLIDSMVAKTDAVVAWVDRFATPDYTQLCQTTASRAYKQLEAMYSLKRAESVGILTRSYTRHKEKTKALRPIQVWRDTVTEEHEGKFTAEMVSEAQRNLSLVKQNGIDRCKNSFGKVTADADSLKQEVKRAYRQLEAWRTSARENVQDNMRELNDLEMMQQLMGLIENVDLPPA